MTIGQIPLIRVHLPSKNTSFQRFTACRVDQKKAITLRGTCVDIDIN